MNLLSLVAALFFFLVLCTGLDFDTTKCENDCEKEIRPDPESICRTKCLQEALEKRAKQGQGDSSKLTAPTIPEIIGTGWQEIELSFNMTGLANYTGVEYILEIKPDWNNHQKDGVFTLFPYLPKYHQTDSTSYSVKDLEPNTGYQFRVMAVRSNESSQFSAWSNVTKTTKDCSDTACGVTNFRIELTSLVPYKGMEHLNSVFYWEPTKLPPKYRNYFYDYKLSRLSILQSYCSDGGFESPIKDSKLRTSMDILGDENLTNYRIEQDRANTHLYYGCWYKFELGAKAYLLSRSLEVYRHWIFNIPDCITFKEKVCGCPYVPITKRSQHDILNISIRSVGASNTSSARVKWKDDLWRTDVNITYYLLQYRLSGEAMNEKSVYIDSYRNVHEYNATFFNLTTNKTYIISLSAFHGDHCIHHRLAKQEFFASSTVCQGVVCHANSTCIQTGVTDEFTCHCDEGFAKSRDEEKCVDLSPCLTKPCGANETCTSENGERICECKANFEKLNGSCFYKCEINPEAKECRISAGGSKDDNSAIIAGVIPALVVLILIAVGVIVWLKYFHRKRMLSIQREFDDGFGFNNRDGTLTNPYDFQHPLAVELPPEGKEINLLYVSQENLVIPDNLVESIGLFELSGDRVRLRGMIGKGAFGEVYIGEAQGINMNPNWTTVAIKTLAESIKQEEFYDFLREIELMKDLGKHENVIQMFGCCTRCRPICLVLEYAPGGNLLNYLRSLKKKCKEIAAARAYAMRKSEKDFEKFFEPGEMPDHSTSYSFPHDAYNRPGESTSSEAAALNLEVASKINEEIRTALDPMELKSFARQIASGMEHVASLDIVHRDLAARNILLNENKVLKISDFGLSREGTYIKQTHGKIPFRWLSIEAIVERFYSTASDVWAFGIVLWEICTLGDVPYPAVSDRDLKDFLLSGKRMAKVDSCTDEIYEIMLKCWSHLPEDRPSFMELSKSLWDLEHEGNTYVNVDSIVQHSLEGPDNENEEEDEKDNNNTDDKSNGEQSALGPLACGKGFDNPGFSQSVENLNAHDQKKLISKEKKSLPTVAEATTAAHDKEIVPQQVANGISSEVD